MNKDNILTFTIHDCMFMIFYVTMGTDHLTGSFMRRSDEINYHKS